MRRRRSARPPERAAGADPAEEAFEAALGALARKERSVAELRAWLEARGFDNAAIAAALERLIEAGQLDDARFAAAYAADKRELRGWGSERIREALEARGVGAGEIAAALAGDPDEAQAERGAELLIARGADLAEESGRGRALAYLVRRGYGSEVAYEAVRRAERAAA
jgi:regulatory protein